LPEATTLGQALSQGDEIVTRLKEEDVSPEERGRPTGRVHAKGGITLLSMGRNGPSEVFSLSFVLENRLKYTGNRQGRVLSSKKSSADGPAPRPDGPRSGLSAVVTRTVRARAESVRVPSFSRDLLPKTAGLTRETVENGSRPPPLYR
jgi:hypothetical protein